MSVDNKNKNVKPLPDTSSITSASSSAAQPVVQDSSGITVMPHASTMSEYKRTAAQGTNLSEEETKAMIEILEGAGDFLVVAPPPDFAAIRKKFADSLKPEYKPAAVLFACQMACQGFKGDNYYETVKINFKNKEVTLGEATDNKAVIQKRTKGVDVVNPRRVCVAFSKIIRAYINKYKIVTTTMKRYNSNESFMFIGGQGSITFAEDANKMLRLIAVKDGPDAANKLLKYFMAVGVAANPNAFP